MGRKEIWGHHCLGASKGRNAHVLAVRVLQGRQRQLWQHRLMASVHPMPAMGASSAGVRNWI